MRYSRNETPKFKKGMTLVLARGFEGTSLDGVSGKVVDVLSNQHPTHSVHSVRKWCHRYELMVIDDTPNSRGRPIWVAEEHLDCPLLDKIDEIMR